MVLYDNTHLGKISAIYKFEWVIDIFSMICKNVGDKLVSPTFRTISKNGIIEWDICLYPKGSDNTRGDYMKLVVNASIKIEQNITVEIVNSKGKSILTCRPLQSCSKKFECLKFVTRRFIFDPANDILTDGQITIVCKIDHKEERLLSLEEKIDTNALETEKKLVASEIDKYEALINGDKFSDVTLVAEGKTIKLNKCILAKSSPVFAAMFDSDMKENQNNTVEITDVKYDVLLEMIRFVYIGRVNDINTMTAELVDVAEKYGLDGLKEMGEEAMCKNLSIANALSYLEHADKYRMAKLKKKGIKFIVANADEVSKQEEFKLLPRLLLSELFLAATVAKDEY